MPPSLYNDIFIEFNNYNKRLAEEREKEINIQDEQVAKYGYKGTVIENNSNLSSLADRIDKVSGASKPK